MSGARRKKPIRTGTIVKIVIGAAVVIAAGAVLVAVLRSKVNQMAATEETEVMTAEVSSGSISTTVAGSGTLSNEDPEDTVISGTVDVTEVYVKAGDTVEAGDMLASVNSASVVKAMKEVQDDIDAVDKEIDALEEEDISDTITAGVDGRVKAIYVSEGDNIAEVMSGNRALMLISVDGKMAVDVKGDLLTVGDEVTVTASDGTDYEGTVDSIWAGKATVLISDEAAEPETSVFVSKSGTEIGSGTLYIHEEVAVVGYTGTVDALKVSENEEVSSGDTLLTLTDISTTVNYASLLEQRAELEDQLIDLVTIYKEGAVYAKQNGMVTSISTTEDSTTTTTTASTGSMMMGSTTTTSTSSDDSAEDGTTISICPTDYMTIELSIDETDILSLEIGQDVDVTVSSLGDDTYTGTITEIDTTGSSSGGVTVYKAVVQVERVDGMLSGMSASAQITIEGKDDALLLPVDAVHKTSSSYYVYTSYDEETQTFGGMVEVTVGISNSNYIEISSGLSEGDTVYYTEQEDNSFDFSSFGSFGGSDFNGFGGSSGFSGFGGSSGFGGGTMPNFN